MQSFEMGRVPSITFGSGRLNNTADIVALLNGGPVLVVADMALAQLGVTAHLQQLLESSGFDCHVAAEISGEPKEALIDALCATARTMQARVVVGLGGGAAMDAAKLIATIAPSGKASNTFALSAAPFPTNGLPSVAIPTTAGTGSEVTRTSIVSTAENTKNWYWGEELMFDHAILDPALTLSLPSHLTAWTGIDAVAHALEAVTSQKSNAAGRLYGLEALRLLSAALPLAVSDGEDIEARGQVLWGSMVAGLALHNCNTHMGHNISHALGSLARVHHGLATGLALDVTLPWMVSRHGGAEKYALAAQAMGGPREASALPGVFSALMRACQIRGELPLVCSGLSAQTLAAEMKSPANWSMSQNAACIVEDHDLDDIAEMIMALPLAQAA